MSLGLILTLTSILVAGAPALRVPRVDPGANSTGSRVVPNFEFDTVEAALGRKIDTLLIDCEGCGAAMMNQLGPKLKQVNLILFEGDMATSDPEAECQPTNDCMDYEKFIAVLQESGFEQVDKLNDCDHSRTHAREGTWCRKTIWHYAFRRKGAPAAPSAAPVAAAAVAGAAATLRQDEFFNPPWLSGPVAPTKTVAADGCDRFKGDSNFKCDIEAAEWALVRKWVPKEATVIEFGARWGTTTCELARQLGNSGHLVTVDPDQHAWANLEENLKTNNCRAHILRGVVNDKPLKILESRYSGRTVAAGNVGNASG